MNMKKTLSALAIICVTTGVGAKAIDGFDIEQYKDDIMNLLPLAEDLKESCDSESKEGACEALDSLQRIINQHATLSTEDDEAGAASALLHSMGDKLSLGYESAKKSLGEMADDPEGTANEWAEKAGAFAKSLNNSEQMKEVKSFLADQLKDSE